MKKVEIVVGGCLHGCAEPDAAVAGLLEALADGSDPGKVASFVDSTQFVLDGERFGERWAGLWRDMKAATRKEEVLSTVAGLAASLKAMPTNQLKLALSSGARPVKVWTSIAIYEMPFPGAPQPWTLTFKPRGLEWLVVEIDRGGKRGAGILKK
jgi:hypothetical protein